MSILGRKVWVWTGALALLVLSCTSCATPSTTTGPSPRVTGATHFAIPGKSYRLQMPPEYMRARIALLVQAGRAPRYLRLHPRELRRRCPGTAHILGCTKSIRKLKVIYVSSLLRGEELRMVLEHEFAHYLYDWKH